MFISVKKGAMKFSIITITYNRAHLIGETVQSVLNQTYTDFEYIIIDDGSTDNTEAIVRSFNDARIKYFKYKKIGNLSKLINLGIHKSKNNYIAILDSDDLWVNNKLRKINDIFISNIDIAFIIHDIQYFTETTTTIKYYNYESDFYQYILKDLLTFKILPFSVFTFNKKLINTSGFFNENFIDGHQDFFFRVAVKNKIYFYNESLAQIRIHKENTHKKIKFTPFLNYYKSVFQLFIKKKISFFILLYGYILNTKNLIKHYIKR